MRILFLDIDGVLNWKGTWRHTWYGEEQKGVCHLEPKCCELFHQISKELKLTTVLSSTWRTSEITVDYLKQRGILEYLHPTDPYTPSIGLRDYSRGYEIDDWINNHSTEISKVSGYCILDDTAQFSPHQRKRFIQTSWDYGGLQEKHLKKIRQLDWA